MAQALEAGPVCRRARPLLGTLVDVLAEGPDAAAAAAAAFMEIAAVHALLSFHAPDSELQAINRAAPGARIAVDFRTLAVLRLAATLHASSARAFDCRTGDARRLADTRFPVAFDGAAVIKLTTAPMDLGGIAKGYAVDRAIEAMRAHGIDRAVVNAGGDLRHHGARPVGIDIRDPHNSASIATTILLDNAALASSVAGGLAAREGDASRIHRPDQRALPPRAGATVQAPTCMHADALAKVVLASSDPAHPLLERYGARTVVYSAG